MREKNRRNEKKVAPLVLESSFMWKKGSAMERKGPLGVPKQFQTWLYNMGSTNGRRAGNEGRGGAWGLFQKKKQSLRWTVYIDLGRTWTFLVCRNSLVFVRQTSNRLVSNGKASGLFWFGFFNSLKTSSNWEGVGKPFVLMKGRIQKRISADIEKTASNRLCRRGTGRGQKQNGRHWYMRTNEMALGIKKIHICWDCVAFDKKKGTDTFQIVIGVEALGREMWSVATSSGR